MSRQPMPLDEFLKSIAAEAFVLCEEKFAPVNDDRKRKMSLWTFTQLASVVPESFLHFLETRKDPETLIKAMFHKISGAPPPLQIQVEAGDFDREHILEEVTIRVVGDIIALIFLAPPESSEFSSFMKDIKELHDFLLQKRATSLMTDAPNGEDVENFHINLGPDDKTKLIADYSRSIVSIPSLIKKIADPEARTGQYL